MTKTLRGHYGDLEKERLKRWVFKRFLKTVSDGLTWRSLGAKCSAVGKRRSKKLDRRWLKKCASDNKWWWRSGVETLTGLDISGCFVAIAIHC